MISGHEGNHHHERTQANLDDGTWRSEDRFRRRLLRWRREAQARELRDTVGSQTAARAIVLDISKGTASVSRRMTLRAAAEKWRAHLESEDRERATLAQYEQHLRLHILPVLGRKKLSELNLETVQSFRKYLLAEDEKGTPVRSRALAAKIWITFKSLLKHGRVAYLAQGVSGITPNKRGKRKLEIGVDVPTNEEVKRLYLATAGNAPGQKRKRALLLVAAFCGLRASELRGLRWADVKLDEGELQVTQRADRYNVIGHAKSESSRRTVPLSPDVVRDDARRVWPLVQGSGPNRACCIDRVCSRLSAARIAARNEIHK